MNHTNRLWLRRALLILAMVGLAGGAVLQAQDQGASTPLPASDDGELPAPAPVDHSPVHIILLDGAVSEVMQSRLERQAREAEDDGASMIVLEMDTWGGGAIAALEMSDFIKNLQPRVVAWVRPKAISAGAMISLAADDIVMAERSRIGDCMPISGSGESLGAAEREKIETVIREEFRDSARRHGYPTALCISMVTRGPAVYEIKHNESKQIRYVSATELDAYGLTDEDARAIKTYSTADPNRPQEPQPEEEKPLGPLGEAAKKLIGEEVPEKPVEPEGPAVAGVTPTTDMPYDSGKWTVVRRVVGEKQLLTMSQTEAAELGFSKGIVRNHTELAEYLNIDPAQFVIVGANWSEELVAFLTNPLMRGLLTIVMLMGLYSEMQSPGLGLPGGVAVVAFLLLVGAPYLTGLASMLEVLVILLGLILLAVEVFVLPGFGVAGISGLVLIFAGLLMTFIPEGRGFTPPNLPGTWDAARTGLITLVVSLFIACVGFFFLTKYFGKLPLVNRLVLDGEQQPLTAAFGAFGGGTATVAAVSVGDEGQVVARLRPSGTVQFDCGIVQVLTAGELIEAGTRVKVTEAQGNRIVVQEA